MRTIIKIAILNSPAIAAAIYGLAAGNLLAALFPPLLAAAGVAYYWLISRLYLKQIKLRPPPTSLKHLAHKTARTFGVKAEFAVTDDPLPRAFTAYVGPRRYIVAVSSGLLSILTSKEVEAVLGHELAHIKNRDFILKSFLNLYRFANIPLGQLFYATLSRDREYQADETAATLTGKYLELASAILKVASHEAQKEPPGIAKLSTHQLAQIFSEHPAPEARVKRLLKLYKTQKPKSEPQQKTAVKHARSKHRLENTCRIA